MEELLPGLLKMVGEEFGIAGKWIVTAILLGLSVALIVGSLHYSLEFSERIGRRLNRPYRFARSHMPSLGFSRIPFRNAIKRIAGPLETGDIVIVVVFVALATVLVLALAIAGYSEYSNSAILFLGAYTLLVVSRADRERLNKALEHNAKDGAEIDAIIRLLQTQTLVLQQDRDKEAKAYLFSKVFVAIADYLSEGITPNYLGKQILKGLGLADGDHWTFQNDAVTHLSGVLHQHGLVERHIEEYQHWVDQSMYSIVNAQPAHLSKGTLTRYFLTPLGATVVLKLRRQSVAGMAGSPIE